MELGSKDFIPIPITDFTKGVTIPVDIYIRLGEEKFVLVGKAGASSNVEQFSNYRNKAVNYLWVLTKEYYKIAHQSISLAGMAINRKDIAVQNKSTLLANAARSVFRQLDTSGIDLEIYNNAKQISEAVMSMVDQHKTLSDIMSSLAAFSDQLMAHSVAVSSLSVMVGQALGYEKRITLEKLAMGGLLHDIGLKTLPIELISKPVAAMTAAEIQLYETHAFKGMHMLQSLGLVPDDIVSIVYEHHENSIGQGFPQRLRDVKIHPLAKVVALVDAYVDLILPNANCPQPKNAREALVYIEHTLGVPYNKEAFRALKRVVDGVKKPGAPGMPAA